MIYLVTNQYDPGTAHTNRVLGFAKEFKAKGINFKLVFAHPNYDFIRLNNSSNLPEILYTWPKFGKIQIKRLNLYWYFLCKFISFFRISRFASRLSDEDIVILMGCSDFLGNFVNSKAKIYYEITEHPEIVLRKTDKLSIKQYYKNCSKVKGLFVISSSLKQLFIEHGVNEEIISIINMTVDPNRFQYLIHSKNLFPFIAYCGNASNNKDGVDDLIKAFSLVSKKNEQIKLYIIGEAPRLEASSKENNIRLVESLGLKNRVIFTGKKDPDEIPQILKNASILILARPDNKQAKFGFPTKLGEYLLSGNPTVITETSDIPLFLKDGVSSMLAKPGNVQDIAEKIIWLLQNPDKAKAIGQNGKKVALENFTSSSQSLKIIEKINLQ